jgi:citronellyl-CoA dehydrogenase
MMQFQHERFSAIPMAYVWARQMIADAVEYLKGRIVFGKPLIKKQVLRHRIAKWLTEIECLQQLAYHIVRMKMAGQDATLMISMAKLKSGDLLTEVADGCLQMYGGMGFMNDMKISRFYRDSRLISIGGGASEVMCDVIAKFSGL